MDKEYKFGVFDGSWLISRTHFMLIAQRKKSIPLALPNGDLALDENGNTIMVDQYCHTKQDIIRAFFWAIAKYIRDHHTCQMPIVAWDKHEYHKVKILSSLGDYKGDRHYASEEDLEGLDPVKDAKQIWDIKEEIRANNMKSAAKYWIVNNFESLGIPQLILDGYEADDFAYLFSQWAEQTQQKCFVCSSDTDWNYFANPYCDKVKPDGKVITYDEMREENKSNVPLYKFKSYVDSIYGSHNNLFDSRQPETGRMDKFLIIEELEKGDYTHVKEDLFKVQMASFDVYSYPEIDIALNMIENIQFVNKPLSVQMMRTFTAGEFTVSNSYYENFVGNTIDASIYMGVKLG